MDHKNLLQIVNNAAESLALQPNNQERIAHLVWALDYASRKIAEREELRARQGV